jgi:hypothetical protein
MGIRADVSSSEGSIFSQDVLKIEICGPDEDYLTVIDVPGIFRNHDEGVTTKEDVKLVMNMVKEYIRDSRTIILAVLASNVDIANQEILTLAEDYDKTGERTLGVFTKCDLLMKEQAAQAALCNVVLGKKKRLTLGYHVVINRGADEKDETLEQLEEDFQKEPWSNLPPDRVGVRALKDRLGELLGHITRQEFPKLRREVREMLDAAQKELEGLGVSRQTEWERRLFLSGIARQFQDLTAAGLEAQYSGHRAFETDHLRLITHIVELSDIFSHDIETKGHLWNFEDTESTTPSTPPRELSPAATSRKEKKPSIVDSSNESVISTEDSDQGAFPELCGIVCYDSIVEDPRDGIMDWIRDLYIRSRGADLASFGGHALSSAFKEQSGNWNSITKAYVSKVIVTIHQFIIDVLGTLCTDPRVHGELLAAVSDEVLQRYKAAMENTLFLVSVERDSKPYTLNQSFSMNLQIARGNRMADDLQSKGRTVFWVDSDDYKTADGEFIIGAKAIKTATRTKSNVDLAQEQIHDSLSAYYKVARERFVDNVYRQVVHHCLLTGPQSPLAVFSQDWVIALEAGQVDAIAGESPAVRGRRERLAKRIEDMKAAIEILKH